MEKSIKVNHNFRLIDALFLLMHITYGMSMLKVWLLDAIPLRGVYVLFLISIIIYPLRFGFRFRLLKAKNNGIFWIFIMLYVADIIQNVSFNIEEVPYRFAFMLDLFLFMEYIYSLYLEGKKRGKNSLNNVTKYYEYYNLYNIIVVFLCLILIIIGVLSSRDNPMHINSLIQGNVEVGGQYYFPGHLSLAIDSQRGLAIFDLPVLTGLSHEPHVLFLFLGPCFFLFLLRTSNNTSLNLFLYFLYFALLVISTSASAIIVFGTVFIIDQLYKIFIDENKGRNIVALLFILGVLSIFLSKGGLVFEDISTMMVNKVGGDADIGSMGSKSFSLAMLYYMVSPQSLLGRGNMPEGTGPEVLGQDIGYISCVLDLTFAFIYLFYTIKYVFNKDRQIHYYGMMFLYFFLHNLKMSVQSFNYPYISFFVVLLVIVGNVMDGKSVNSKKIIKNKKPIVTHRESPQDISISLR